MTKSPTEQTPAQGKIVRMPGIEMHKDTVQVILTGRIGVQITAAGVDETLRRIGQRPIEILLRSEGGSFFEAGHIYRRLREKPAIKITAIQAYSGALWIFLAADRRVIAKNGEVMTHNVRQDLTGAGLTPTQLREHATHLEALGELYRGFVIERTGLSREVVCDFMETEAYIKAERAVELGFATEIGDEIY